MLANIITFFYMLKALIVKEFLAIIKDKASRSILIIPPIIQSIIFGNVATYDLQNVNYVFVDNANTYESRLLNDNIKSSKFFNEIETDGSFNTINNLFAEQKIIMIIQVDNKFSDDLKSKQSTYIQATVDGRNSTSAGTALFYLSNVVNNFNKETLKLNISPIKYEYRYRFNENNVTRWNIMPSLIATLSMIQIIMLASFAIAREREKGTFEQLLVTPASSTIILLGKSIAPIIIGIGQSTIILLVSLFVFNIKFIGSYVDLYISLFLFSSACVGIGLTISSLSANMQQAMLYSFVILIPLCLLSGLMTPISNMPEVWQHVMYINPLKYEIDMCKRIYLEGASIKDLYYNTIPLLAISTITMPIASYYFKNKT